MLTLENCIDGVYLLPSDTKKVFMSYFRETKYPAKTIIVREGDVCDKLYFIAEGCLRASYHHEEKDVILWFGIEGDLVGCFGSMITMKPGQETIILNEDCTFYEIDREDLYKLIQIYPEVNRFYNKVLEEGYLYLEMRIMNLVFCTAKERYESLVKRYPLALQRFSIGQIASYLGITIETLSRIRAGKT
jgi:CRP-like cAMP-binding protein